MGRIGHAGFAALLGAWLALAAPAAPAAVYKCKGSEGERVYSDSGCVTRGGFERPTANAVDPLQAGKPAAGAQGQAEVAADVVVEDVDADTGTGSVERRPPGDYTPRDPSLPHAKQVVPGFRVLFLIGAGLLLLSYVLMFASAFRDNLTAWGVLLVLFSPLTMLLYPIFHWRRARVSFVMFLLGALLCAAFFVMPVDMITVEQSYLTSRPGRLSSKKAATTTFSAADTIYLRTELEWQDSWVETTHWVTWTWYTGDMQKAEYQVQLKFDRSPYVIQGNLPASELGAGQHRVEVFVDGRQLDAREFHVRP